MRVPLGVAWVTALSGPFADSVCGPWPSKRDKTGAYPRLRGRGMGRFRSVAITVIVLVAALSTRISAVRAKVAAASEGAVINRLRTERLPRSMPVTTRAPSRIVWPANRPRIMAAIPAASRPIIPPNRKGR